MAGYDCDLCSGEERASVLITPLAGGETMAVGESCMAVAFTGMLAGHLQIDPEKLFAACERLIKAEAKKAPKGKPGTEAASVGGEGLALVPDTGPEDQAEGGAE